MLLIANIVTTSKALVPTSEALVTTSVQRAVPFGADKTFGRFGGEEVRFGVPFDLGESQGTTNQTT